MSIVPRIRRCIATAGVIGTLACGHSTFDPKKFDAVRAAAESVRADASADRLRVFDSEVSRAQGWVSGAGEKSAIESYAQAAEAYKYLLRFREMDPDALGGMILLRGANRPLAMRYGIPIEERGGGRWVNRTNATDVFAKRADAALAEADRTIEQRSAR